MFRKADKAEKMFKEWAGGKMHIGKSKKTVPDTEAGHEQAIAIVLSKMGKSKKK